MNGASIEPHQIPRPLDETVNRHIFLKQVLQVWPPRSHQKVNVVPVKRQHKNKYVLAYIELLWVKLEDFAIILSAAVLFAKVVDDAPVWFRHSKPLTVTRTNVDVDGAEIIVLLMTLQQTNKQKNTQSTI